ncbi:DUF4870 domain-containing protein [Zobellia galactanivorans]|uniref:Conserved hypothetical membrane protein n=1 Tax=Zobellia galactanivorans (strain DSM 12802 / CCUG 47099 / CIP 106680 / NCIMB 13871 / Dsij) TaxID=63186 RepID=G0L2V1_ZOBGA|nr:DUF4870 domain-containing protein [Zobellia galactanivorans]CAZ98215.1 Conserved hypothetical membrane protein [Zobellia galactanivorans]
MDQTTIDKGKTMAIISYITLIGTLVAYIMNNKEQNEFAKFHIGQALRAWLTGIVVSIIAAVLIVVTGIGLLSYLQYIGLILAVIGLMNAVNGKAEKIPLVGDIG